MNGSVEGCLTAQKHNGRADPPVTFPVLLSSPEPGSHRSRCIADSGFDTQSDLSWRSSRFHERSENQPSAEVTQGNKNKDAHSAWG